MASASGDPLLEQVLRAVDTGVLVVGRDGTVVLANETAQQILGLDAAPERMPPRGVEFLTSAGLPIPADRLPWRTGTTHGVGLRAVLRTPSGAAQDVLLTCLPLDPPGGEPLGYVVNLELDRNGARASAEGSAPVAEPLVTATEELTRTRVLQEVAVVATTSTELDVVCRRILSILRTELSLRAGDIRILSEDGATLRLLAAVGYPDTMLARIGETCADAPGPLTNEALRSGDILTHEHVSAIPGRAEVLKETPVCGMRYVAVPIDFRGKSAGVVSLVFEGRRAFDQAEIELFHAIAHTIGQAIENARLMAAEKAARQEATSELGLSNLLLETAHALAHPLELQEVIDRLAEAVRKTTARSRVIVGLYEPGEEMVSVRATLGPTSFQAPMDLPVRELAQAVERAVEQKRPQQVGWDDPELSGDERRRLQDDHVLSGLVVPIVSRDRVVGVILVDDPGEARPFPEREVRLVEAIAAQAAVVIENAKLYDTEHRIAETLQEALHVMPDRVAGVTFGTLYRSATTAARVGGDFYDLFETGPDRIALVVGDVSGKGLDAASITALARDTIRAHAIEDVAPAEVMARVNRALMRFTSAETFVTAFFGVLDVRTGGLVYVIAGHPDGYVVGPHGYVHPLAGQSPLLGSLEDADYEERYVLLAPDDTVFLYTDGVTEARRGRELYGCERLAGFLAAVSDNGPQTLPETVFGDVRRFCEGRFRDDIAMLAVKRERPATEDEA